MKCGNYAQLFDAEELRVARGLVRQYRRNKVLWDLYAEEDLLQEVLIHWYGVRNQHRDDGASRTTFMNRVLENRLREIHRAAKAQKRQHEAVPLSAEIGDDLTLEDVISAPDGDGDLKADLQRVLEHLTPRQRALLELLAQGTPQTHAAKQLNIHRDTVNREIHQIRKVFEDRGLKDYVE